MSSIAAWLDGIWDDDEARLTGPTFCGPVWPTTDQLLARIAADRRILEMYRRALTAEEGEPTKGAAWSAYREERVAFQRALEALASVYADRPGYRQEWKP